MPTKKTIVLADDEQGVLDVVQFRLTKKGYNVIVAHDGEEALASVKKSSPDLVILDVNMPPPNGLQVCRQLKDDAKYKNIPVVLLTAGDTDSDKFWGAESGADAYLTKPYNAEELLALIKKLTT